MRGDCMPTKESSGCSLEAEPVSDRQRAQRIRDLLCDLHREVREARDDGLEVTLKDIHTLGSPMWWPGYLDALTIKRPL